MRAERRWRNQRGRGIPGVNRWLAEEILRAAGRERFHRRRLGRACAAADRADQEHERQHGKRPHRGHLHHLLRCMSQHLKARYISALQNVA